MGESLVKVEELLPSNHYRYCQVITESRANKVCVCVCVECYDKELRNVLACEVEGTPGYIQEEVKIC